MNIRSIDLQLLIPHANEVGKAQHNVNQQPALQQHDFATQWQKISQDRQQQVQTVNESENPKIKKKQDTPGKQRRQSQSQSHEQHRCEEQHPLPQSAIVNDSPLGHTIDIKT